MSRADALARGRAAAEKGMTDGCRVVSGTGEPVWNEASLEYDVGAETLAYQGPCLIKAGRVQPRAVDAAGQALIESTLEAHFPMVGSESIQPNHVVVVTRSATDQALVGRRFRVTGPFAALI